MFEYDPAKSEANKRKHGIDFEEAKALWADDGRIIVPSHLVAGEERSLVIGKTRQKLWAAIVTRRGEATRIISVRRARDYEVDAYDGA